MSPVTKKNIISDVIERTGVHDQDCGFIIETKDGKILDNTEATRKDLRSAVAIEDWNSEENQIWGVFADKK